MRERRSHQRYKIELLGIAGVTLKANNIDIIDISLSGISLHATMRLNVGEEYAIKIQSGGIVLNLKGLVIWSKISKSHNGFNGDSIPVYTAGLEFRDVAKDKRDEIAKFIASHKKSNGEDDEIDLEPKKNLRRYPRVCVNTPVESFLIDKSQCLPVKDLSFGGFRMESKSAIKINSTVPLMINCSDDKFIVFQGRVTSCRLTKRVYPKVYDIGIEFNKMSAKDRKTLSEFIRLLDNIDKSPSE
jgi:PilZ domain